MLFDYVRIRFPTTDVRYVVETILKLKLGFMIHEDFGFYSYSEHYYMGVLWYTKVVTFRSDKIE